MPQSKFPIDIKFLAAIKNINGISSASDIARKYGVKDRKIVRI